MDAIEMSIIWAFAWGGATASTGIVKCDFYSMLQHGF